MILIINETENERISLQKSFFDLGMNAHSCNFKSSHELLARYRFDAILLTDASKYERADLLCKNLKASFPKIPLIMLAQNEETDLLDKIIKHADNIILSGTPLKKVVEIIFE